MINFSMELPDFELYLVGGFVRDSMLGVKSKDIDIVCEADSFESMLAWIESTHKKVFLSKPEFLTVRAMGFDGMAYDYVLARKDGSYTDSRRPDSVSAGTIYEDLSRRDFSIGAMAYNIKAGELLDPFNGAQDLKTKTLRCVGSTKDRFSEDPLRIMRAIRFCITKGFTPSQEIKDVFLGMNGEDDWADKIIASVSMDRIREEMTKCFKFDTEATMRFFILKLSPSFLLLFRGTGLWLKPTTEKK